MVLLAIPFLHSIFSGIAISGFKNELTCKFLLSSKPNLNELKIV